MYQHIEEIKKQILQIVKGKDEIVTKVLCAILAGGHVLLEDIPGVGKTTLALSMSKSMSLTYKRMQFTPDVLPSDITGFSVYHKKTETFDFKEGAAFCNLFLADEINRTSSRTQSALLEVMEEGKISVEGVTRVVPSPFFVIATQNPEGSAGTNRLPESQLDRFMVKLSIGYPDHKNAVAILKENIADKLSKLCPIITLEQLSLLMEETKQVFVHNCMYEYMVSLTEKTRESDFFELGISPRGSIALLKMAKAHAFICNRNYVIPEDIIDVFPDVACHRVLLKNKKVEHINAVKDILEQVVMAVPVPRT